MFRTTVELIAELKAETPNFTWVALVVALPNTTMLIHAEDTNRIRDLDFAVSKGGRPLGIIGAKTANGMTEYSRRVFADCPDRDDADDYLRELILTVAAEISAGDLNPEPGEIN